MTSYLASPAMAETAILTATTGHQGGVSVTEVDVPNEKGCQDLAYISAMAINGIHGKHHSGSTTVLCVDSKSLAPVSSYKCIPPDGMSEKASCSKLELP